MNAFNVLVVGNGGREHAIALKLRDSPKVAKIFSSPVNVGISQFGECADIDVMDFDNLIRFAKAKEIDLAVVSPDNPLAGGLVDRFTEVGIRAFGPTQKAAEIESSKVFSKSLMKKYNIPTAAYEVFNSSKSALSYIKGRNSFPTVIKADGLALGKGVVIANNVSEAEIALHDIMDEKIFGESGNSVVVEDFLTGTEVSIMAFTDGKTIKPMVSAQDYKKIYDGNLGPNTGGMGSFSPSQVYDNETANWCMENIFVPTVDAMRLEGRKFKGVLYFGLILTESGVKVIEYNSRFGDPETQAVLPRLKTDLFDIFQAVIHEKLDEIEIEWDDDAAVCVVLASGGYPKDYEKGFEITGITEAENFGATVFHSGTKLEGGKSLTNGGRVLGVMARGASVQKAAEKAYRCAGNIDFNGKYFRHDIGS